MKAFIAAILLGGAISWGAEEAKVEVEITRHEQGFIVDVINESPVQAAEMEYLPREWTKTQAPVESEHGFLHRVQTIQDLKARTLMTIKHELPEGLVEIAQFIVPDLDANQKSFTLELHEVKVLAKAEWLKTQLPPGNRGILLGLINDHRARHGLNRLVYDPKLDIADDASHRNYYNMGFGRIGGAGAWSSTTNPYTSFSMWQRSGGHNAQMLKRGITRGGIGFGPGSNFMGAP